MIPKYINEWFEIIEKMSNATTYKLAWGRAIIECITQNNYEEYDIDNIYLKINDISENVLSYYWNQYYFFRLKQAGPTSKNKSVIMEEVEKLIEIYQDIVENTYPEWFQKAVVILKKNKTQEYNKCIKSIGSNLLNNPCRYFVHLGNEKYNNVYTRVKNNIIIRKCNLDYLKEYSSVLINLLNYKWSQLLEDYNSAPKITQKVDRAARNEINRKNLKKYIEFIKLASENKPIDFYTGKEIPVNEISVDHVIPWSFMYSDDIWNLVLTTKSNNSSKNNRVPTEEEIKKLNERNEYLISIIDNDKYKNILKEAIDNHYVDKFYNNCKYDFKI